MSCATDQQESCVSRVSTFIDLFPEKTDSHLPWTTSNWFFSKDDVKGNFITETTTSKEKLPANRDILFTWFYRNY